MSNNQEHIRVYSLRQRYLFVSAFIVLLIFAFAWLAQNHVTRSSQQHRYNIELRQQATHLIRQLRNEVLSTEKGLEAYMWDPSAATREGIHHGIDSSLFYFSQLSGHEWFDHKALKEELGDFKLDLKALHITLDRVMDMRLDDTANRPDPDEFNINLSHAAQHFDIVNEELQKLLPHQPQLDTTMLLWRQLQQHVQAFTTTEAEAERLNRTQKINELYRQLNDVVEGLNDIPSIARHPQGPQLLREMREAMNLWQLSFDELRYNSGEVNRHSEVHYLKHTVEPHFEHLWEYIRKLELQVESFAKNDTTTLEQVAGTIAKAVWLLCFFGLFVIATAYIYFLRTVLHPIATIAEALKQDANNDESPTIPQVYNLETRHLIDAYEEMRHQVMDRQNALEHIAMHDSLTGLPNRYQLMGKLQAHCETFGKQGAIFSVMMIGLDRFKEINDTLGQKTGDDILKKFGHRLRLMLRDHDMVSRFASDEFAVLLLHTDREEALYVARNIRMEMEQPFDVDGISLSISCSIGIALFPAHSAQHDELTRRATIAMATAKQHKVGISVYDERYDTSSVERISLAGMLRQAIQSDTLQLHYQAQFSAQGNRLSGLEVLCHWEDTERGPISPVEFIPIAEQTGQIHALTEWVLATALQQAKVWERRGLDFGILSVNISAFNLHAQNFLSMLEGQLKRWDFPPHRLMLEVTETAMMVDPDQAIRTTREIHQLGVKLSIDDYGTGFSSLAYVKQLPVHELKIDKSFVMDMTLNENDAVIVRSTIDLAHNLGLKVVAEGVDSQEKADLLEILNCDYLQGHHLGIPVPAQQVEEILPPASAKSGKITHLRDFR